MCMFRDRIEHQTLICPFCFPIPVRHGRFEHRIFFPNLFWEKSMILVY